MNRVNKGSSLKWGATKKFLHSKRLATLEFAELSEPGDSFWIHSSRIDKVSYLMACDPPRTWGGTRISVISSSSMAKSWPTWRINPQTIPNSQKQKQLRNTQWVKYVCCPALLTLEVGRARRNQSTNTLWKNVFQKAFAVLWQLKGQYSRSSCERFFPKNCCPPHFSFHLPNRHHPHPLCPLHHLHFLYHFLHHLLYIYIYIYIYVYIYIYTIIIIIIITIIITYICLTYIIYTTYTIFPSTTSIYDMPYYLQHIHDLHHHRHHYILYITHITYIFSTIFSTVHHHNHHFHHHHHHRHQSHLHHLHHLHNFSINLIYMTYIIYNAYMTYIIIIIITIIIIIIIYISTSSTSPTSSNLSNFTSLTKSSSSSTT